MGHKRAVKRRMVGGDRPCVWGSCYAEKGSRRRRTRASCGRSRSGRSTCTRSAARAAGPSPPRYSRWDFRAMKCKTPRGARRRKKGGFWIIRCPVRDGRTACCRDGESPDFCSPSRRGAAMSSWRTSARGALPRGAVGQDPRLYLCCRAWRSRSVVFTREAPLWFAVRAGDEHAGAHRARGVDGGASRGRSGGLRAGVQALLSMGAQEILLVSPRYQAPRTCDAFTLSALCKAHCFERPAEERVHVIAPELPQGIGALSRTLRTHANRPDMRLRHRRWTGCSKAGVCRARAYCPFGGVTDQPTGCTGSVMTPSRT